MVTAGYRALFLVTVFLRGVLQVSSDARCIGRDRIKCPSEASFFGDLALNYSGLDFMIEYDTKVQDLTALSIYADCSSPCNGTMSSVYYYDFTNVLQANFHPKGIIIDSMTGPLTSAKRMHCHVFGCFTHYNGQREIDHNFMPVNCTRRIPNDNGDKTYIMKGKSDVSSNVSLLEDRVTPGMVKKVDTSTTSANVTSKITIVLATAVTVSSFIAIATTAATMIIIYKFMYIQYHKRHASLKVFQNLSNQSPFQSDDINVKLCISSHQFAVAQTTSQLSLFDHFCHHPPNSSSVPMVDLQLPHKKYLQKDSGYEPYAEGVLSTKENVSSLSQTDTLQQNVPLPSTYTKNREKSTYETNSPNVTCYFSCDGTVKDVEQINYKNSSCSDADNYKIDRTSCYESNYVGNDTEEELKKCQSMDSNFSDILCQAEDSSSSQCDINETKTEEGEILPKLQMLPSSSKILEFPMTDYVPNNSECKRPNFVEANMPSSSTIYYKSSSENFMPSNPEPTAWSSFQYPQNNNYQCHKNSYYKGKYASPAKGGWQENMSCSFYISNDEGDDDMVDCMYPNYLTGNEMTNNLQQLTSKATYYVDETDLTCETSDMMATLDDLSLCAQLSVLSFTDIDREEPKEVHSDYIAADL